MEKSREYFSLRNTHQTQASGVLSGLTRGSRAHWTHQSESGAQHPVCGLLRPSLHMGPVSTGRYRCLASGDPAGLRSSLCTSAVSTGRVRWCCVMREHVLAVGGNGRVQTASDTWLSAEHRTLGLSVRWHPAVSPVPPSSTQ